jgi:hypothetical protein
VGRDGRSDWPYRRAAAPGLVYQFLPIWWGTIGHAGVEFKDMVYESTVLDPYRSVAPGYFRAADRKAPFFVDPQDLSRIWFPDPQSSRVEPIEWRGALGLTGQDQPGMPAAVVVQGDEPPQVILQLPRCQQRLLADKSATLGNVAALVSGDLLQTTLNRFVPTLDMRIVVCLAASVQQQVDPETSQ